MNVVSLYELEYAKLISARNVHLLSISWVSFNRVSYFAWN